MAIGPDVMKANIPAVVAKLESEIDKHLMESLNTEGIVKMPNDVSAFCKILSFRHEVESMLSRKYTQAGWKDMRMEITGPHDVGGCSGESSGGYFRLNFNFRE